MHTLLLFFARNRKDRFAISKMASRPHKNAKKDMLSHILPFLISLLPHSARR